MVIRAYPRPWHVFVDTCADEDTDFEVAATFETEPSQEEVDAAIVECIEGSEREDELVAEEMKQALESGQLEALSKHFSEGEVEEERAARSDEFPVPLGVEFEGSENLPVQVGTQTLPAAARLRLHKIESRVFQPLEFVPLLDLPTGRGLVYLVTLAAHSTDYGFWEGCVHMRTPHDQPFPGTLLSTGTEDYFDSAFGFDSGRFYTPQSGCTHR